MDPVRLAYYRCVRALEDVLLWVLDAADSERLALGQRMEALEIVEGLLSPRGLVMLALGSLRRTG